MACYGGNATHYDVCTENCGDGRNIGILPWDDGNLRNGDGWSSTWYIETGFYCTGSAAKFNKWYETWGDGLNFITFFNCDDGNLVNGDGCSSVWKVETGWRCSYGSPSGPDTWWQIIPYIYSYYLYPDNKILNIKINDTVYIQSTFTVHDWDIYANGPRSNYLLNWHIQDFDVLRQGEHVRDINITLEWDESVQFFGDGLESIHLNITNPNNTISRLYTWPLLKQNITVNTYGQEAGYEWGESQLLRESMIGLLITMLWVNVFAFLTLKISMGYTWSLVFVLGYTWSLVFVLQYISLVPLTNVYIPSWLMWYSKNLGLVNGWNHIIRWNFLPRTYNHYELEPLSAFNYRFTRYGHIYSSFVDNCADILMWWIYAFIWLGFIVMLWEICRSWSYWIHTVRVYKWHMFYRGFMVLYLKVILFSTLNLIKFNVSNALWQISSLLAIIFFGVFVAYPAAHTAFAFKYKKMSLEEKKKHFVYSEVLFDEFAVYKSIQYFYFWQFCIKRMVFAFTILFIKSPVAQLWILMAIFVLNFAWLILVRPFKFYIRMFHSGINDVGGMVLTGLYFQFTKEQFNDTDFFRYALMIMRVVNALIVINIILVITHWIFELIFKLWPFCCLNFRKKMQKAEADDEEVQPEAEVLSSEESVEKQVIVQPPIEIVIPAAGVLVEKGQEYTLEKDTIIETKKKMPKEEIKEIKAQTVEEDENLVINKGRNTPGALENEKTANTFYNSQGNSKLKGLYD